MAMVNTRNAQVRSPEPGVSGVGPRRKELVPLNPRLWQIVVIQAKAKFHTWPSPAASHWAHEKYKQLGGRFKVGGDEDKKLASHQKIEKGKDDKSEDEKKGPKDKRAGSRKSVRRSHKKKR